MKNRALSLLLALLLVLSLLPTFASAENVPEGEPAEEGILMDDGGQLLQCGGTPTDYALLMDDEGDRNVISNRLISAIASRSAEVDVSDIGQTVDFCKACFSGVINDHPQYFYAGTPRYGYYTRSEVKICQTIYLNYKEAYTERDTELFNSVCAAVLAGMPDGTDEEKLLYFHEYLVTHCEYDRDYFVYGESTKHDAYNCLVEGSAVCEGYMLAFKHLCDLARLDAACVISEGLHHGWNIVKLSDEYISDAHYYIDCTWDDPNLDGHPFADYYSGHDNFLRNKWSFIDKDKKCAHLGAGDVDYQDWKNGYGELLYNYTTTDKYEYGVGWWRDLIRPVQWSGSLMCYAKPTDRSHVYFRESGATAETAVELAGGEARWPVAGSPGNYYKTSFLTVAAVEGDFYYSTPTEIWKLTPGGEMSLVYTLTEAEQAQGSIYGILARGGSIVYYIGEDQYDANDVTGIVTVAEFKPAAPMVTAVPGSGGVDVSWSPVLGAVKYALYRREYTTSWSKWTTVSTDLTGTSYADGAVVSGRDYQYRMKAYGGLWSDYSAATKSVKIQAKPSAPTVTAAAAAGKVNVSWDAVAGATKYALYRREYTTSWSKWATVSTVLTGTGYADDTVVEGRDYQYRMKAYGGLWSDYSAATKSVKLVSKPAAPLPGITYADGQMYVSWSAVAGAKKYALYRSQYKNGVWSKWTTVNTKLTGTEYIDSEVEEGYRYQYRMKAYNGLWSDYSANVNVYSVSVPLAAPTGVTASYAGGKMTVSWNAVPGAIKYAVYRVAYEGGKWGKWEAVSTVIKGAATSCEDKKAVAGVKYQYRMKVFNGLWSSYSKTVTITAE